MKNLLVPSLLAGLSAFAVHGAANAAWTRSYVVSWMEPAMYYGADTGVIEKGTDCPQGSNAEPDWVSELVKAGYTKEEAEWLRNPANPSRSPVHGQNQMAFRGTNRDNVYIHPTSTPESGKFFPVTGKIGEGLDLDGNPNNGFTSPDGQTGIDNEFYHALGCWKTYRGPRTKSSGAQTFNDSMLNGSYTIVVTVTGQGDDPMNDDHVKVGIYNSPDKIVRDANGDVAPDYTFRVQPSQHYEALFDARTVNGTIVSTHPTDEAIIHDTSYAPDLDILKAQIRFQMNTDGALTGYVGGYRDWKKVYDSWVGARGPVIESLTWVRLPDVYYALQRYADYSPSGPGGDKTHISFAMHVDAVPAFVMMPDASTQVASVESFKAEAPPYSPPKPSGFVVDGVVPSTGYPGGPDAVILPPKVAANDKVASNDK